MVSIRSYSPLVAMGNCIDSTASFPLSSANMIPKTGTLKPVSNNFSRHFPISIPTYLHFSKTLAILNLGASSFINLILIGNKVVLV